MMYGSPEARICPAWCCTQKSHAFRISETSSLGRFAVTCRSIRSNRLSISAALTVLRGFEEGATCSLVVGGVPSKVAAEAVVSGDAWGTLEESAGIVCRTVAMLHYR